MTARPAPRPHYLSPNEKVGSPDCLAVFDCESAWTTEDRLEVHRPRLWAAMCIIRHGAEQGRPRIRRLVGDSMAELGDAVDQWARERRETWLYAHNVGFDLAISGLPLHLIERGWTAVDYWIGPEITWMVLKADGHRLVVTDSFSWLPASLYEIGSWVGRRKRRLPGNDAPLEEWGKRVLRDCEVLATALLTVMDWWDDHELGAWSITGASCGWHAARHMFPHRALVVGPDPERTPLERAAIYGGRREAFVAGRVTCRLAVDWDFRQAHATVAATTPLPVSPGRRFGPGLDLAPLLESGSIGTVARVVVTTETPCVPVRHAGEVWWPTGTFETVLCTPELRLLYDLGGRAEVLEAWTYRLGTPLVGWARWVLAVDAGRVPDTPEVCRKVVKTWGRSVIGKFAQRTTRELAQRPATRTGWHFERGRLEEGGAEVDIVTLGGVERFTARDVDGRDAFPAVFAFVESHTRAALTRLVLSRPPGRVLQCDTDGYLERLGWSDLVEAPADVPAPFHLLEKGRYRKVRVISAQHLEWSGGRRMAGVSRHAAELGDDTFAWHDWPGLRWQLQHSRPGTYVRTPRVVHLHLNQVRRWVLADGSTLPVTMTRGVDGANTILPPAWWEADGVAHRLAEEQHPVLAAVLAARKAPPAVA